MPPNYVTPQSCHPTTSAKLKHWYQEAIAKATKSLTSEQLDHVFCWVNAAQYPGMHRFVSIRFGSITSTLKNIKFRYGSVCQFLLPIWCWHVFVWTLMVRSGSVPRSVQADSEIQRFGSVRFGSVSYSFLNTPNLPTIIMDLRGFDSSIILSQRGGILLPIGDFPESLRQAILAGVRNASRRIGRTRHQLSSRIGCQLVHRS